MNFAIYSERKELLHKKEFRTFFTFVPIHLWLYFDIRVSIYLHFCLYYLYLYVLKDKCLKLCFRTETLIEILTLHKIGM